MQGQGGGIPGDAEIAYKCGDAEILSFRITDEGGTSKPRIGSAGVASYDGTTVRLYSSISVCGGVFYANYYSYDLFALTIGDPKDTNVVARSITRNGNIFTVHLVFDQRESHNRWADFELVFAAKPYMICTYEDKKIWKA